MTIYRGWEPVASPPLTLPGLSGSVTARIQGIGVPHRSRLHVADPRRRPGAAGKLPTCGFHLPDPKVWWRGPGLLHRSFGGDGREVLEQLAFEA